MSASGGQQKEYQRLSYGGRRTAHLSCFQLPDGSGLEYTKNGHLRREAAFTQSGLHRLRRSHFSQNRREEGHPSSVDRAAGIGGFAGYDANFQGANCLDFRHKRK